MGPQNHQSFSHDSGNNGRINGTSIGTRVESIKPLPKEIIAVSLSVFFPMFLMLLKTVLLCSNEVMRRGLSPMHPSRLHGTNYYIFINFSITFTLRRMFILNFFCIYTGEFLFTNINKLIYI